MGFLEDFAGGFAIVVIISMMVITIGFLVHSVNADGDTPKELTQRQLAIASAVNVLLAIAWGYLAWSDYADDAGDTLLIALMALAAIGSLLSAVQDVRKALRMQQT